MDIINYIKHIENFSINYKPKKSKILIYDALSVKYAKNLFKNLPMTVFHTRYEGLSIYILFKTFFEKGFSNFVENYKKNFFLFVNPKIIFSAIDNNIGFFKLKLFYPYSTYIADQNGMRNNEFYFQCKKYLQSKKSNKLYSDYFFCFGENEKKRLKKIISSKIYPLGKTLNNSNKSNAIKKFRLKNIIFISSLNLDVFPVDLKAFNYLIKICLKKKIKLYYIDRVKMNNFDLLKKNTINDSYIYIKNKHVDPNMKKFSKDSVFLFSHSTFGYELLSRGFRVGSFNNNHIEHFIKKKYPNSGPFWQNSVTLDSLNKLILKIENYSSIEWKRIVKKYSKELLVYDSDNISKKKIINKVLYK